jgi:hypothetical protein
MQKGLCFVLLACLAAAPAANVWARPSGNPEMQLLKQRQKQERKALKMRRHFAKESMRGQKASPALRAQMKHQMQREQRDLREKQKDEMQEVKDRVRLNKENRKLYGQ